ncbi:HD-GYP domain-containing protein [candidate division KSB1 bacterium]
MKLRIPRDELKVGMYIERAVLDKSDKSDTQVDFIKDVLIDSEKTLNKLKQMHIKFLFIDTAKFQKIEPEKKPDPKPKPEPKPDPKPEPIVEEIKDPEPEVELTPEVEEMLDNFDDDGSKKESKVLVPFDKELEKAREIKTVAVNTVKNMLKDAAVGKSFETKEAKNQANEMVKSVFRNTDAMLSLTRLKSFDEYTFTHSVNVSVIAVAMAKELKYDKDRIKTIGLGCMLHDVGKMRVPDEILNKPGKLTPEERKVIQNHPLFSEEILKERDDIPDLAKHIAYEHHEKANGEGYPRGMTLDEVKEESAIATIADVYDALTSARVYKPGMPPPQALSFIKARAETEFRADFVDRFIEVLGIFPVGSVIEYNTGQIGIVKEVNRENLFHPKAVIVMNVSRQKVGVGKIIEPRHYEEKNYKIIRHLDPLDLEINISEYLDKDQLRM